MAKKQSDLEKIGIQNRKEITVKNDYNKNENAQYGPGVKDALSTPDDTVHPERGRGVENSDYIHIIPQPFDTNTKNMLSHQIKTENAGNSYDIYGRNDLGGRQKLENYSKYNKNNQYSANSIDTETNVEDGQYIVK